MYNETNPEPYITTTGKLPEVECPNCKLLLKEIETRNYACGDALEKLWQEIIIANKPDYGPWEYPGQAYRHLKAEFDEMRDSLRYCCNSLQDEVTARLDAEKERDDLRKWSVKP